MKKVIKQVTVAFATPQSWITSHKFILSLLLFVFALSLFTVLGHGQEMSPIDEWVYIDYLHKIPAQFLVLPGELINSQDLKLMSCTGAIPFGPQGPPCDSTFLPQDFPLNGRTTADAYTPIFFWVTWILALPLRLFGLNEIIAWRLISVLWLLSSVVVIHKLGKHLGVPKFAIVLGTLVLVSSPFSYWTFTYISTDAPGVFLGGLLLYLVITKSPGAGRTYVLIALAVVTILFKPSNVLALGLVAIVITISIIQAWRFTSAVVRAKGLMLSVAVLVVPIVFEFIWLKFHSLLPVEKIVEQGVTEPLTVGGFISLFAYPIGGVLTTGVYIPNRPIIDMLPFPSVLASPIMWVSVAGLVGSFLMSTRQTITRAISSATLVVALVSGPILALMIILGTGGYFQIPNRYVGSISVPIVLSVMLIAKSKLPSNIASAYFALLALSQPIASFLLTKRQ